jgi:hypothetical protein
MGWGVADGEPYEAVVEARLNREIPPDGPRRYEILNFAVAGYVLPHQMLLVDRALDFAPDVLLLATHMERVEASDYLFNRAKAGMAMPFDTLQRIVADAGVGPGADAGARRRLADHEDGIEAWIFRRIAARCRERRVVPLVVFVPSPDGVVSRDRGRTLRLASAAGFRTLDLSGAFDGHDLKMLQLTTFDFHPNAAGHRLLADRLYRLLADSVLAPGEIQIAGTP